MKLYIPSVGDFIILTEDWTFSLVEESRNNSLFRFFGGTPDSSYPCSRKSISGTLPKGTVLKVDRVYIRNGRVGFNSISFLVKKASFSFRGKLRFWVKLEETRKIEFEPYEDK